MQVSKHFQIQEFLPQVIFNTHEDHGLSLLHPQLIDSTERLREYLGVSMIINNWYNGGTFQNRGWRHPDSKVGAKKSLHKKGMAIDFHSSDVTIKELFILVWNAREWIVENTAFRIVESFDDTPGWVHLAIGDQSIKTIQVVKP